MRSNNIPTKNRRDTDDNCDRALIGMMRTSTNEMQVCVRQSRMLVAQTRLLIRRLDERRPSNLFA